MKLRANIAVARNFSFALLALLLAMSPSTTFASEKPQEQLNAPKPPVSGVGGYSGIYYEDQLSLQRPTFKEGYRSEP